MVIKKQPIISWLLEPNYKYNFAKITPYGLDNDIHFGYLCNGLGELTDLQQINLNWGLPEFISRSFEKAMEKSAKSFYAIDHQLFQEFSNDKVCGILIHNLLGTVVFYFADSKLFVWLFKHCEDISFLYDFFYIESTERNTRKIFCNPSLIHDKQLYPDEPPTKLYACVADILISYLALKKYAKVETIVIPAHSMKTIEDNIDGKLQKEKIKNVSGQKVIVIDSRWFVKIVNDNDIFVRGFWRLQNKKKPTGEWYKELIFVDSFTRHGYHRNAKIEDDSHEDNTAKD